MSITDELRKWAEDNTLKDRVLSTCPPQHAVHGVLETLLRIADRIDATHEGALVSSYFDGVFSDGELAENGFIRLPVDADGEYIHVGDVMEWADPDGEVTVTCTVDAVGVGCFFAWDSANGRYAQKCANAYSHYHAQTVEDVLRGVVTLCHNTWKEKSAFEFYDVDDVMKSGNIAEYAAKLRLAEGEDV